jgi:hypothetical protein
MKRRRFIQALAATPIAPAMLAQQGGQQAQPAGQQPPPPEAAPLDFAVAEEGADGILSFFSQRQFATLRRVCDLMVPMAPGAPGALDCRVPEFLDFLIGNSPPERKQLWLRGLDALESASQTRFSRAFAATDAAQADALLAPLHQPWTYEPGADPIAQLLAVAKLDVRTATFNSVERNAGGPRRQGGGGLYWLPVE